jgi:hypothetical protein
MNASEIPKYRLLGRGYQALPFRSFLAVDFRGSSRVHLHPTDSDLNHRALFTCPLTRSVSLKPLEAPTQLAGVFTRDLKLSQALPAL